MSFVGRPSLSRSALSRTLLVPVTTALALSVVLGGCSGDDDEPSADETSLSPEEQAKADDAAREAQRLLGSQEKGCRVEATVTGAVEASWSGKAIVRTPGSEDDGDSPAATYVSTKGDNQLSVYSVGEGFEKPAVTYTNGDTTYSASDGSGELDVAEDASGATVDVELTGIEDDTVQLQATYTCGKAGRKAKSRG